MKSVKKTKKYILFNELFYVGLILQSLFLAVLYIRNFNSGFSDLPGLSPYLLVFVVLVVVSVMVLSYVYAFKLVKSEDVRLILMFTLFFMITMFVMRPMMSDDVYSYIGIGRIISVFGQNPYTTPYVEFSDDPLFEKLSNDWSEFPVVYGPLFTHIIGLITLFGGGSLIVNLYLFKLVNVILFLFCAYFIYKTTNNIKSLYLFVWNPYILFMTVGELHNDLYWIVLVLASIYLLKNNRHDRKLIGFLLLCLSVFFKFFSVFLLPIWVIYLTRKQKMQKRLLMLIFYLFIFLAVGVLSYFYFWEGPSIFQMILDVNANERHMSSPLILIFEGFFRVITGDFQQTVSRLLSLAIFLVVYFRELFLFFDKHDHKDLIRSSVVVMSAFVLTSLTWFMSWYLLSPIILMIVYIGVSRNYRLNKILYTYLAYAILYAVVVN